MVPLDRVCRLIAFIVFIPEDVLRGEVPEIEQLCDEALSPQVLDWVADAERNQPYISGSGKNAFGKPVSSRLVLTEGWRRLQERGFEKGYVLWSALEPRHPIPHLCFRVLTLTCPEVGSRLKAMNPNSLSMVGSFSICDYCSGRARAPIRLVLKRCRMVLAGCCNVN